MVKYSTFLIGRVLYFQISDSNEHRLHILFFEIQLIFNYRDSQLQVDENSNYIIWSLVRLVMKKFLTYLNLSFVNDNSIDHVDITIRKTLRLLSDRSNHRYYGYHRMQNITIGTAAKIILNNIMYDPILPLSPYDTLKHNFTSLKTDLIFLQPMGLERKFPWFTNTLQF